MPACHYAIRLFVVAFLIFVSTPSPSFADHRSPVNANRLYLARAGVSLDVAVARVQRETGGRVLSAKTVNESGRRVHQIKVLLPSGKVRVYHVDAGG